MSGGLDYWDSLAPEHKLRWQQIDDSHYKPLKEGPQLDRVHEETQRLLRMPVRKKFLRNNS